MRRVAIALALISAVLWTPAARAQEGDSATLALSSAEVGQQVLLRLEVMTEEGATVEVDPASESWASVEVIRVESQQEFPEDAGVRHVIEVVIAPFGAGTLEFTPVVNVISGVDSQPRLLPVQQVDILETLPADAPLELSPLPPPASISGEESPFLWPAIGLGVVLGVLLLGAATFFAVRTIARRPRTRSALPELPNARPDLGYASALLESDPVAAYRTLAAAVRRHLADTYGFPAAALTARELEQRMEKEGMDRFQARLVGGLLENCDAVVYAGYRPASERRQADLTMAREIVEALA